MQFPRQSEIQTGHKLCWGQIERLPAQEGCLWNSVIILCLCWDGRLLMSPIAFFLSTLFIDYILHFTPLPPNNCTIWWSASWQESRKRAVIFQMPFSLKQILLFKFFFLIVVQLLNPAAAWEGSTHTGRDWEKFGLQSWWASWKEAGFTGLEQCIWGSGKKLCTGKLWSSRISFTQPDSNIMLFEYSFLIVEISLSFSLPIYLWCLSILIKPQVFLSLVMKMWLLEYSNNHVFTIMVSLWVQPASNQRLLGSAWVEWSMVQLFWISYWLWKS